MTAYSLQLRTLSATSPGSTREKSFLVSAYRYLPGGTLRGALAGVWISRNGDPTAQPHRFRDQVESLRVGPGLPTGATQVPVSVATCKYRPAPDCANVAFDLAFGDDAAPGELCPQCNASPLELGKGQWVPLGAGPATRLQLASSTELDDQERAREGRLFTRQTIPAGHDFSARADGDLSWLEDGEVHLRVGGRRSVAGHVALTKRQADPDSEPLDGLLDEHTVVLRLLGPAVFLDGAGRGSPTPTTGDLTRLVAGLGLSAPRLDRAWTRTEIVGGWNAAARMPKATEVATSAGSVFRLHFDTPIEHTTLRALVQQGLGVRRADGYGWVTATRWRSSPAAGDDFADQRYGSSVETISDQIRSLGMDYRAWIQARLRAGETHPDVAARSAYRALTPEARAVTETVLTLDQQARDLLLIILRGVT